MRFIRFKRGRRCHWTVGIDESQKRYQHLRTACGQSSADHPGSMESLDRRFARWPLCPGCAAVIAQVYDVLVMRCGAPDTPEDRTMFAAQFPDCGEYRFGGSLGFGGKVYWSARRLYVSFYPEDRTPERDAARDAANCDLQGLIAA